MASGFVNEEEGFVSLSEVEFEALQQLRAQAQKPPLKYYTEYKGR